MNWNRYSNIFQTSECLRKMTYGRREKIAYIRDKPIAAVVRESKDRARSGNRNLLKRINTHPVIMHLHRPNRSRNLDRASAVATLLGAGRAGTRAGVFVTEFFAFVSRSNNLLTDVARFLTHKMLITIGLLLTFGELQSSEKRI